MEVKTVDAPPESKQQKKSSQPPQRITIKNPEYSYSHLKMIFDPPLDPPSEVDAITWRMTLTNSLMQYLGVVGSSIHIDILHIEGDEALLRISTVDMVKFGAAVSGFVGTNEGRIVGFKTVGNAAFLMGLIGKSREKDVWG